MGTAFFLLYTNFIVLQKVFGISMRKKQTDNKIKMLLQENNNLKEENLKLSLKISRLKREIGKVIELTHKIYNIHTYIINTKSNK